MKILFHHRTMGRGAEGVHISSLVTAFKALGNGVQIISPPNVDPLRDAGSTVFQVMSASADHESFIGSNLKKLSRSVPQFVFEILEILYNLYAWLNIFKSIRRHSPDIFYERYAFFSFAGIFLARKKAIPSILEVNEISGLKRFRGQTFIRLASWIETMIFHNADLIVVVSSFLKKKIMKKGISPEKIVVLPNGVDLEKFKELTCSEDIDAIRERYHIVKTDLVFGFVGWFADWDRLDKLVGIIGELSSEIPNIKLMLVGDGYVRSFLEKKIDELELRGKVIITGAVAREEVQNYIHVVDIGVFPHSNLFGSPIAMFEFMAAGKPVIAPELDPITDVITDGVNGLIFPCGDFNSLLELMRKLIFDKSLREKLGKHARQEIRDKHTWIKKGQTVIKIAGQLQLK